MAKSQGSKPVIFVDGDKIRRLRQLRIEERHPDAPIITLNERHEIEDLVPRDRYFQALAEIAGQNTLPDDFDKWIIARNLPERMMFSKRIETCLDDTFSDAIYNKPEVMKKAIELTDSANIDPVPFIKLVRAMSDLMTT